MNSFASLQEEEEEMDIKTDMEQDAGNIGNNENAGIARNTTNAGNTGNAGNTESRPQTMQIPDKTVQWYDTAPSTSPSQENTSIKTNNAPTMKKNAWTPIRLKWKDRTIDKNSSIAKTDINEESQDNNTLKSSHPVTT